MAQSKKSAEEKDFITMGAEIWHAHHNGDEPMASIAKRLGIGVRKAYYLAEIHGVFDRLPFKRDDLLPVGWKKLHMISGAVDWDSGEELLRLAASNPVHRLEELLAGRPTKGRTHTVLLHLDDDQYQRFRTALLERGAKPGARGRGLQNKEAALDSLLQSVVDG